MSTTFADMVDEVILNVSGYTQRQDQATYLIADMDESATQFQVNDGTVLTRGIVEIDDELVWVDSFDRVNGIAYISPAGRAFRNSTLAPHFTGARVTVAPSFPRVVVKKQINNAIKAVYPTLYGAFYTTFPFVASRSTYPLPSEAIDVLSATWETVGPTKEWLAIRRLKVDKTANVGAFNTGKSISIFDGIVPGRTVNVVYSKRPTELVLPADEFTDTGLIDSAEEVIILGASYRMAMNLDVAKSVAQDAAADIIDNSQQGTGSAGATASRYFFAQYKERLAQEKARQDEMFPVRIRYTR